MEIAPPVCPRHPDRAASDRCQACGRSLCPGCLIELQGRRVCQECKYQVLSGTFRVGQAIPVAAGSENLIRLETDARAVGRACANHSESEAVTLCERCGDYICPVCITAFQGKFYCTGCFDLMWRRNELGSRSSLGGWALGLSLMGLLSFACLPSAATAHDFALVVIALLMAAGAQLPGIGCAVTELRRKGENSPIHQRRMAWAALIISALYISAYLGVAIFS